MIYFHLIYLATSIFMADDFTTFCKIYLGFFITHCIIKGIYKLILNIDDKYFTFKKPDNTKITPYFYNPKTSDMKPIDSEGFAENLYKDYYFIRDYDVPVFEDGKVDLSNMKIGLSDLKGIDLLDGRLQISNMHRTYTTRGYPSGYSIGIIFNEMHLSKTLKSRDFNTLGDKIQDVIISWTMKYQLFLEQRYSENRENYVEGMNRQAQEEIHKLNKILHNSLSIESYLNWNEMKRQFPFTIKPCELVKDEKQRELIIFNSDGCPINFEKKILPEEPTLEKIKMSYGFFYKFFFKKLIKLELDKRYQTWIKDCELINQKNIEHEALFNKTIQTFKDKKNEFEKEQQCFNDTIENLKLRYENADINAIEEYCDLVLNNSNYPDFFPLAWMIEYQKEGKIMVIEYDLPSPSNLPTIESYKYIKSRDEIVEKHMTVSAQKQLFESVIYQVCLRTIYELFKTDVINALDAIAFNGLVTNTNPATGVVETKVILSVVAKKEEFSCFNLANVDPKATFKHLKGIAAANLIDLTPIPPIMKIDRTDKRFVNGKYVVDNLDESINLAAMHWEDFEHLVRELFEKEFAANGGEVKVTQTSRDGGVDAIAFDPDPIRGGKIVIQAKRYTNIVGVNAVRDLYGTVVNEGATKGILVTTSNYGKDSYEFAKGKPITLLNGNNLLALLKKHGHNARINVKEAKRIMNSNL